MYLHKETDDANVLKIQKMDATGGLVHIVIRELKYKT